MSLPRLIPVLALAASLLSPLAANAQTTDAPAPMPTGSPAAGYHHHHGHHRSSLMHALRSLNLSDAQKQQVAAFHRQEVAANAGADPATRKANAAKMRDQVMGILTADQQSQLHAAMHRGGHGPMNAPAPAQTPGH